MAVNREKLDNLILFFAGNSKITTLGTTKLYKLLFFADVFHLRDFGHTITSSEYIKYPHGPVPSKGEKALKSLKKENAIVVTRKQLGNDRELHQIKAIRPANLSIFSETEIQVMERVVIELGNHTAAALSNASHKEPSWALAQLSKPLDVDLMLYGVEEDPNGL